MSRSGEILLCRAPTIPSHTPIESYTNGDKTNAMQVLWHSMYVGLAGGSFLCSLARCGTEVGQIMALSSCLRSKTQTSTYVATLWNAWQRDIASFCARNIQARSVSIPFQHRLHNPPQSSTSPLHIPTSQKQPHHAFDRTKISPSAWLSLLTNSLSPAWSQASPASLKHVLIVRLGELQLAGSWADMTSVPKV